MPWSGRTSQVQRVIGALMGACVLSHAAVAQEEPAEESDAIAVPIPVGQDAKGLKIPLYGDHGKLTMTLKMERAEKLDESQMQMEGAEVETFDEEGEPDLRISLPKAVLNLETRVVTSEDPVSIAREDFSLSGDTMEFFLKTRNGKLTGQIRMLIYDRNKLATDETE